MTFIAGICHLQGGSGDDPRIDAMAAAQKALAPNGTQVRGLGSATFVGGTTQLLPEDRFGTGPRISSDGLRLLVADVRLDNRAELLERLGLQLSAPISDAWLLLRAYDRFGQDFVNHALGDFAIAVWDAERRSLLLARDITGQRPLNYHLAPNELAFSTMPHGLIALEPACRLPDERQIAEFLADIPRSGRRTFFQKICRVEPGHIVRIDRSGVSSRAFWSGPSHTTRLASDRDYIEGLREQLARATEVRLRGAGAHVGAQLSGGLDSGAVAATAAMLLRERGGRVSAFTSAPREGFAGPIPQGRIGDETALASKVAALHPNLDHRVVRSSGISPLSIIRRDSGLFGEPLGLPCNQVWVSGIAYAASAAGLSVMLVGDMGNHTLSHGGAATLAQYARAGQPAALLREARDLHRRGLRWRGIAYAAFAPWLPLPLWQAVMRAQWGRSTATEGRALMSQSALQVLAEGDVPQSRSSRPSADQRAERVRLLQDADPGLFRKGTLAGWGIDERDPTADRQVIDFTLSLPPEQMLRDGVTRRLARHALADRLPPEVLDGPRGYQGADWYERFSPEMLLEAAEDLAGRLGDDSPLNLSAIKSAVLSWPTEGWETGSVISRYRYGLLRAIAMAAFLAAFREGAGLTALRHSKGEAKRS